MQRVAGETVGEFGRFDEVAHEEVAQRVHVDRPAGRMGLADQAVEQPVHRIERGIAVAADGARAAPRGPRRGSPDVARRLVEEGEAEPGAEARAAVQPGRRLVDIGDEGGGADRR